MMLSTREKALIVVLVVLVLASVLYFGVGGLRARLHDTESLLSAHQAQLQKAAALMAELRNIERPAARRRAPGTRSLIGYVEQLADRIGVKDRIQLNLIPQETRSGLQGLDIRVSRLSLDEFVNLLYTLEDSDYRLMIDQLELSPSFRDKDLLRLSMRVLARP